MNLDQLKSVAKWRAQFNPLRGLTFQRAVSLLEEGERGAYADLQWLYRFIEKRDATLRALVKLRTSAIAGLDWDIKLVDDPALAVAAQAQAAALRAAYEKLENLTEAIRFLALAEFRGFAHLEKIYSGDNPASAVVRLEPVPQWHWVRDTLYSPWCYNAPAASTNRGEAVDLQHFVVREVDSPINEIGLLCFLRKNLSQKDWDGFVEVYGIPPLFAMLPANIPPGKEGEYQAMAEGVVADMRGTIPNGGDIKTVDAGARGVNPFREHLAYQDEQLVLAGTSGKLTMLSAPTGIGGGATDAHQDTFASLAEAEAAEISELFQDQFDRAVLDAAGFAGQPALAYFRLAAEDKADIGQILDHAVKASQAGYSIDAAELAEKTGYKLTAAAPQPLPPGPFGAPEPRSLNRAAPASSRSSALASLDAARRQVFAPLLAQLAVVEQAKDPGAYADALGAFRSEATRLAPSLMGDPALGSALETILGEAAAQGAVATLKKAL
jgi:hypothetical protein